MSAGLVSLIMALTVTGCGNKQNKDGDYPDNFGSIGDAGRVAYVIRHATPDSVARFIIYGSLGRVPGARIDTLAIATNYAYGALKGEDLDKFSVEYDAILETMPLSDKMKVYVLAGSEDPQGLGYKLGLEYLMNIRDAHKSVKEVKEEIEAFRKVCGSDQDTYHRFIVGFRTALKEDGGTGLAPGVYSTFINIQ